MHIMDLLSTLNSTRSQQSLGNLRRKLVVFYYRPVSQDEDADKIFY